ncbi:hypothetical protein FACS1894198_6660 [Clostridia bacterium]|nr:hypothetical protein FACS1894198_6660 [Clostridia bacterium]
MKSKKSLQKILCIVLAMASVSSVVMPVSCAVRSFAELSDNIKQNSAALCRWARGKQQIKSEQTPLSAAQKIVDAAIEIIEGLFSGEKEKLARWRAANNSSVESLISLAKEAYSIVWETNKGTKRGWFAPEDLFYAAACDAWVDGWLSEDGKQDQVGFTLRNLYRAVYGLFRVLDCVPEAEGKQPKRHQEGQGKEPNANNPAWFTALADSQDAYKRAVAAAQDALVSRRKPEDVTNGLLGVRKDIFLWLLGRQKMLAKRAMAGMAQQAYTWVKDAGTRFVNVNEDLADEYLGKLWQSIEKHLGSIHAETCTATPKIIDRILRVLKLMFSDYFSIKAISGWENSESNNLADLAKFIGTCYSNVAQQIVPNVGEKIPTLDEVKKAVESGSTTFSYTGNRASNRVLFLAHNTYKALSTLNELSHMVPVGASQQ